LWESGSSSAWNCSLLPNARPPETITFALCSSGRSLSEASRPTNALRPESSGASTGSMVAEPPSASALYSLEVPRQGGDTGFSNMYLAYETLPAELRRQIAGRRCRHDASRNSAGELRRGFVDAADPSQTVGAEHPILRTHPVTGKTALFLGRRRNAYIPGMPLAESEALLDALWAHAGRPELAWYQQWQAGDLVLWDNRCVMHRRDAFDPNARRVMHRTQIRGDRPY